MSDAFRRTQGLIAAGMLALLTLGVFYLLQHYGPESAVREFHEAVLRKDTVGISRVSTLDLRFRSTQWLASNLEQILANGTRVRFQKTIREPRLALVEVVYTGQKGGKLALWWSVVQTPSGQWKVDPDRTVELATQSTGF